MNWERINIWLSLAANLGVLGGILFLAYEINQNTSQMRSEASYSITESLLTLNGDQYRDPELLNILLRGGEDFDSLTPLEKRQFSAYQFSRVSLAEYILNLEREGLSDVQFPYIDALVLDFRRSPGLSEWLDFAKPVWTGSDELLEMLTTP